VRVSSGIGACLQAVNAVSHDRPPDTTRLASRRHIQPREQDHESFGSIGLRRPRSRWRLIIIGLLATLLGPCPGLATTHMELAVTIDDLPTTGALPPDTTRVSIVDRMVEILRRHAVPAVYGFANAGQLRDDPAYENILLAWRKGGFLFGNHTLSHLDLDRVSTSEFVADIEGNEALLEPLAPPGAPKFFRYPYLHQGNEREKRAAVRSWLASRGYRIAPVTVYVEHWEWSNAYARCVAQKDGRAIKRVKEMYLETSKARLAWARQVSAQLFKRQIKHILLLHADAIDAAILDDLLRAHRAAGVTLISLESALQDPAYGTYVDEAGDGDHTFLVQAARAQGLDIPSLRVGAPPVVDRTCR